MFRHIATLASVVAVAGVLAVSSSQAASIAEPLTMTNNLTFSKAVALPGVTLAAGTYVFESGPGGTNPNIVRVLSQNRQKQFYLGFTVPQIRPRERADGHPDIRRSRRRCGRADPRVVSGRVEFRS